MSPTENLLAVYFAAKKILESVRNGKEVSLDDIVRAVEAVEFEDVEETVPCVLEELPSAPEETKPKRKKK